MNLNLGKFKRNVKLQQLGIGKLSKIEQKILDFFNEHLSNLNEYTAPGYHGEVYLGKSKNKKDIKVLIFYRKQAIVYVSNELFQPFFKELNMGVGSNSQQNLLNWWIVDELNIPAVGSIGFFNLGDIPLP